MDLNGLPIAAPSQPKKRLRFADVAVTATANEFAGIYRNKQYHPPDFTSTLDRAHAAGVEKIILTGMSLADVDVNLGLAKSYPNQCSVTIGVHPYHAAIPESELSDCMAKLKQRVRDALAENPRHISAFGELGLDYDRLSHASKEDQIRVFKAQLDLIVEEKWDLPLFLHCRAAFDDFIDIISPYLPQLPRKGLVHSFVGSTPQMQQLVTLGLDIGVNGFSFQARESLDMVSAIPLDHLQLETDAPWGEIKTTSEVAKRYCVHAPWAPQSKKRDKWQAECMVKERNESCMIAGVAFVVAGVMGVEVDVVADAAWGNSGEMFGLRLGERCDGDGSEKD